LYDVKKYKNKAEFERDKNKHYADITKSGSYRYEPPLLSLRLVARYKQLPFSYLHDKK